jgi:hypothetical protein
VLTCKEPAADAVTGSKPEHETKVADAAVVDEILRAFGLEHLVATRGVQVAVPRRGDDAEVASLCIFSNRAGFIQTG